MFAWGKHVGKKRVGAHALMGLPRLKLAQAQARVMPLSYQREVSDFLSRPLSASINTNFA